MAARATPRWWGIRPWQGAVIALAALAGAAAAQPAGKNSPRLPASAPDEDDEVERPIVAVINLRDDADSKELAAAVARAITAAPELTPVSDYSIARALVDELGDEDIQAVSNARDKLRQAHEKMGELDLDYATTVAEEGQKDMVKAVPTAASTELLADLVFAEGQARFARRHQDRSEIARAKAAFAWVHRLSPGRKLDPDTYLDDLIDAFTGAAKTAGAATLKIKAEGTIWIDGVEQPAGTRTATVVPGRHIVTATGPEQQPSGQIVEVFDGQQDFNVELPRKTATGSVQIARARKALKHAPDPTAEAGAMATIQRIAGVSAAVIVTNDASGGLGVRLWRTRTGFGAVSTAKQPWSAEAERALEPLIPKKKVIDKPDPFILGPLLPVETEKPWYRKRWVQVTIVAGVIGVIAGSIAISNAAGASERGLIPPVELPPGMGRQ